MPALPDARRHAVEIARIAVERLRLGEDERLHERVLARKVAIQSGAAETGPAGHVLHGCPPQADFLALSDRSEHDPRPGAGGHLYVFVHPSSTGGVLLELIQE